MRRALLIALYEYLLVTLPVALYVSLEALERGDSSHFLSSPEWAIATIFLSFQGLSLYWQKLNKTGRRVNAPALGVFALGALLVIVGAAINAYESLRQASAWSTRVRAGLFMFASIGFLLFVASAEFIHIRAHPRRHGS